MTLVKSKINKRRKTSRAKLIVKMVTLAKDIAKARDNHTCQHCGRKVTGVNCQGSHIISVGRSKNMSFNPDNIDTMCYGCHKRFWHAEPLLSMEWFKKKDPIRMKRLIDESNNPNNHSLKEWELEEIYNKLQTQYQKLISVNGTQDQTYEKLSD